MAEWKAPNRPNHEITQSFNDGIVKIYSTRDIAEPGYRPVEGLKFKIMLRYEEQRLGIQRYYAGRQNQIQIEKILRVPRTDNIDNQDIAVTETGKQYRIDLIQSVLDVYPPSVDITLIKIEQEYEVSN